MQPGTNDQSSETEIDQSSETEMVILSHAVLSTPLMQSTFMHVSSFVHTLVSAVFVWSHPFVHDQSVTNPCIASGYCYSII